MMQFFSKNFFAKIFPIKYFQRKTDIPPTPTPPVRQPSTTFAQSGYYNEDIEIPIEGQSSYSLSGKVVVITEINYENEEEIIELFNILFTYFDNNITNNYNLIIDEEEELIQIFAMIDW